MKLTLLSKLAVFLPDQKVKAKILISWEQKKYLRWNKKHLFIIFKGLSVSENCDRPESVCLAAQIALAFHC